LKIPKDKLLHFAAGIILCLIGGIWLAVAGGIAKEVYDYFHPEKHKAELLDFVATLAGGFLVYIMR